MSVYFVKEKGWWRYDFTIKGNRYTEACFKSKKEALKAEAERKEGIINPQSLPTIQTDMDFLELVNAKLDHAKAYNSEYHYRDLCYGARRFVNQWGTLTCKEITKKMVEDYMIAKGKISPCAANQELRYLRAIFNYGKKRDLVDVNPTQGIEFLPVKENDKYIPSSEDLDKLIQAATPDTQDYLWCVRDTMGRIGEINQLIWDDIDFADRYVTLRTRKKKGGNLTARKVPMTDMLFDVLSKRFIRRDKSKPWVFWHTYKSRRTGEMVTGPYKDRKVIMWNLCKKANIDYFRFHAIRHAGASILANNDVPIIDIKDILGHEKITTTEIYMHSSENGKRNAITMYERARKKSHTDSHTKINKGLDGLSNPSILLVSPVGIEPTT